jgi:hypothetical protein
MFSESHPNLTYFVENIGRVEIGYDQDSPLTSFIRATDEGGMVWEGKNEYRNIEEEERALGAIALADIVREESREAIARLQSMGIDCLMLTGDAEAMAKSVADELGLSQYFAEVLPDEKAKRIEAVQRDGRIVARWHPRRRGRWKPPLAEIETVCVHDLAPSGDEVADKLLLIVILGIDLGIGSQDRVGAKDQIDPGGGPFDLAGLAIANLVQIRAHGLPAIGHLGQIDEEVIA